MIKNISYQIDRIAFLLLPIILILIAINFGNDEIFKLWGNISIYIIFVILFMKPIIFIIGYKSLIQFLVFRRHLGITSFRFAVFHSGFMIYNYELFSINYYIGLDNYLFWGVIAIIGMIILGVTTNYYSIKKLGQNWKKIQYLAYPVFFLGVLHSEIGVTKMSEYEDIYNNGYYGLYKVLIIFIIFLLLKYIGYLSYNKKILTIYDIINKPEIIS